MEKLELKHLAIYFPFGLKWHYSGEEEFDGRPRMYIVRGHDWDTLTLHHPDVGVGHVALSWGKPVLRPLSDLIVERDGKIDLVELAKIGAGEEFREYVITTTPFTLTVIDNESKYGFIVGLYNVDMSVFDDKKSVFHSVENQLQLFEYLFQNHYDIFGLIEAGLAIDINKLEL